MKKNILKFSLFFLSLAVAFFAWFCLSNAITVPNSSVWFLPMIWFSLFYIIYSLEFVLVSEKLLISFSIILGIFSSLIFVHTFWHFLVLLLATSFFFLSFRQIKHDLSQNVKLCLPKTLRMGKISFIFALALVISSQYYFQTKAIGLLKLPVFDADVILENSWIRNILHKLNPDLQKLENKNLTVDEFILENYQENMDSPDASNLSSQISNGQIISPANLEKMRALQKQQILEAGRKQFGKMADQTLTGSEKVSNVLAESLNRKIQSLVSPDYASSGFPTVPIGMATILFLTVLSLGAFLVRILVYPIDGVFWIFLSTKVITIKKVPVEMEMLE
jgi:hypothetical protein